MQGRKHRFKMMRKSCLQITALILACQLALPLRPVLAAEETFPAQAVDADKVKKSKESLYVDMFDQVAYEEGVQFLRLGDLFRKITFSKSPARDVNIFDELPDSLFFTNRHAVKPLSKQALKDGAEGIAPSSGKWTVFRGKMEGINPGFFVKDSGTGQEFLLKFDPIDNPELASAAESISARFFHAIGYHVPAYHVVKFKLEDLEVDPNAEYYDSTGFKKKLTKQEVEELLLFVAREEDGSYRASASTILKGGNKGPFDLDRHRKGDPNDSIPHRYLRSIRALRVFASWVNYYDIRTGNTLDMVENLNGKNVVKHYVIDFGSTLGSAGVDAKPPQMGHEYIFDFGEFFKSISALGFWKKPWQKRWDENDRKIAIPSVGYFDNRHFNPGRWKNQIPYHALKDLTAADGYWAAKIVMSFSDDDIAALVDTGELSDPEAKNALTKTLIERRDLIGRYWFEKSCPLESFEISRDASGLRIEAQDLMSHYGLAKPPRRYRYCVCKSNIRGEQDEPVFILNDQAAAGLPDTFVLSIQAKRSDGKWGKRVCLILKKQADGLELSGIKREL